ncbi:ImmA/IrrE family metallo-endopeptidase [Salinibacillus xinjiangensis]|uniref:ImmA/IrrE family metallo-endopeptidase n=1 Tax=Salinibacillus xinjiangensis TaxID=1229268 RepID=A0A6G1X7P6_9BACI|nr:ImmA/IrrE family metallo-endopeptidase [Salinibacillus xinjiangensis]MRG86967.1 ImmA/IrrE family metallo-endopeptidase [Salinibacillus xinjiangensis]
MEEIARKLNINIYYGDSSFRFGNNIVLKKSSKQKEWQDFGHELCHVLWHEGNQLNMPLPFRDLQEWQSINFAHHFCAPTFMLLELKDVNVYNIMETFNVDYCFAKKRMGMFVQRIFNGGVVI